MSDYEKYWLEVIGRWSADAAIGEFELNRSDRRALAEWLAKREDEAKKKRPSWDQPDADTWREFRRQALDELQAVCRDVP